MKSKRKKVRKDRPKHVSVSDLPIRELPYQSDDEIISNLKTCLNCKNDTSLIKNGFCDYCNFTLSNDEKEKLKNDHLEKIAKPWKDSESLFCDTKFLKDLMGKEPRRGYECKDNKDDE